MAQNTEKDHPLLGIKPDLMSLTGIKEDLMSISLRGMSAGVQNILAATVIICDRLEKLTERVLSIDEELKSIDKVVTSLCNNNP
jgi:hypothetical protein